LLIALAGPASAEDCEALDAARLQELVAESRDALFSEDLERFDAVGLTLAVDVPCMDDVVSAETWADYLVTLSILAYSTKGDWQSPLESALRADPAVDRVVGEGHQVRSWTPPQIADDVSGRTPTGIDVYLDGRLVRYLTVLRGPHLIQARQGEALRSAFVDADGADAWDAVLAAPVEPPLVAVAESPVETEEPPNADTAPPPKPEKVPMFQRDGWWMLGSGVLVAGGGTTLALVAYNNGTSGVRSTAHWTGLVALNTTGWTATVVGAGLMGWGTTRLVKTRRVSVALAPGGLVVGGTL